MLISLADFARTGGKNSGMKELEKNWFEKTGKNSSLKELQKRLWFERAEKILV